jgi:hypothetical protein
MWPIFEALYWALRESGLNMALTEQLNIKLSGFKARI